MDGIGTKNPNLDFPPIKTARLERCVATGQRIAVCIVDRIARSIPLKLRAMYMWTCQTLLCMFCRWMAGICSASKTQWVAVKIVWCYRVFFFLEIRFLL